MRTGAPLAAAILVAIAGCSRPERTPAGPELDLPGCPAGRHPDRGRHRRAGPGTPGSRPRLLGRRPPTMAAPVPTRGYSASPQADSDQADAATDGPRTRRRLAGTGGRWRGQD